MFSLSVFFPLYSYGFYLILFDVFPVVFLRIVTIKVWDTSHPMLGLSIEKVIVESHVRCLLRDPRRSALLVLSCTMRDREQGSCLAGKTHSFPSKIRLPSTTVRSHYLNPGHYWPCVLIQIIFILLAHSDEPYIYAELWQSHDPDSTS